MRVIKVETGSTWIDLLSSAAVVAVLNRLLAAAVSFYKQHYTTTGRLGTVEGLSEQFEKLLSRIDQAERFGIDLESVKDKLGATARGLAEASNGLIGQSLSVVINDENHAIQKDFARLTANRDVPLLPAAESVQQVPSDDEMSNVESTASADIDEGDSDLKDD